MNGWMLAAALAAAAAALLAAAIGLGARRWDRATEALLADLQAAATAPAVAHVDLARETAELPPPVRRYLHGVLTDGAPVVRRVALAHHGHFNMGSEPGRPQWRAFTSDQVVVTHPPGFVWNARIAALPGVPVRVHDAYVAGRGRLHAALAGLLTVAELQGGGAVAEGELMRYLAEAPWYPSGLLPSQGVRWTAVDDRQADATLRDGDTEVTLRFVFGTDGLVAAVQADGRARAVGDRMVPTPWVGRWSRYAWRSGQRVPLDGEVAWLLPDGEMTYWRGTLTTLQPSPPAADAVPFQPR